MDDATVRVLIEETVARSVSKVRAATFRPGTVKNPNGPMVLVDGDVDPIEVPSICGPVRTGDRVMVVFYPPSGAVVVGTISPPLWAPVWCQISGVTTVASGGQENLATATEDYDPLGWHSPSANTHRITPTIAGWYSAALLVVWPNDIDWLRAHGAVSRNGVVIQEDERGPVPSGRHPTNNINSVRFMMNGTTDWVAGLGSQDNSSTNSHPATWTFMLRLEQATG